jgi:hypothetical protein
MVFCELLLDGSSNVIAPDATAKQNFRKLLGPNHVQDQNASTREKSGAGSWRKAKKQSREQAANMNKY